MTRPIKLISDSTADLPRELIEKYDIQVLPLTVTLGENNFKDGIEISWHETEGVSGYRLYIRIDGKWQKITDIKGRQAGKYIYKNVFLRCLPDFIDFYIRTMKCCIILSGTESNQV